MDVVFTPGAVLLPWANSSNVGAVLAMFLPGLEVGHAVADVLFGDVVLRDAKNCSPQTNKVGIASLAAHNRC